MKYLPFLSLLMLCTAAGAATLPPNAVLNNLNSTPEIILAQQKLALAQSRVQQDDAWQVTASGDTGLDGTAGKTTWNASSTLSVQHRGPQVLDDARLTRLLTLKRAEFAVRKAQMTELRRRVNGWHALRLAGQAVESAALSQKAAQLALQIAEARAAQGTANAVQVDTARLGVQRAELGVRQAAQQLAQARAELNLPNVDGSSAEAGAWVALPLPTVPAILSREDLLEATLNVTEAQAVLERESQSALPTLQLSGGLNQGNFSFSADVDRQLTTNLSATARLNPSPASWNLGLKGSIRLDGAARRVVESAKFTLEQAKITLQSTQTRAQRDVQNKGLAVNTAQENLNLAQAQAKAAQDNARIAAERLGLGLIGVNDEMNARLEAAKASEALFTAQRSLDIATLDLCEGMGWMP